MQIIIKTQVKNYRYGQIKYLKFRNLNFENGISRISKISFDHQIPNQQDCQGQCIT